MAGARSTAFIQPCAVTHRFVHASRGSSRACSLKSICAEACWLAGRPVSHLVSWGHSASGHHCAL